MHTRRTDLSFEVKPGSSLVISGPSGVGKSSILRVIAGLWPFEAGTSNRFVVSLFADDCTVTKPSGGVFFVPQRSYVTQGSLGTYTYTVTHRRTGSLREQLAYPTPVAGLRW